MHPCHDQGTRQVGAARQAPDMLLADILLGGQTVEYARTLETYPALRSPSRPAPRTGRLRYRDWPRPALHKPFGADEPRMSMSGNHA
jgi:hypothetical protein